MARYLTTDDDLDVDFTQNGKYMLNLAYHVYDNEVSVQSGFS